MHIKFGCEVLLDSRVNANGGCLYFSTLFGGKVLSWSKQIDVDIISSFKFLRKNKTIFYFLFNSHPSLVI